MEPIQLSTLLKIRAYFVQWQLKLPKMGMHTSEDLRQLLLQANEVHFIDLFIVRL